MALRGFKVIEMAGLAPGPFCGMILADHGAQVIRIDKVKAIQTDTLARGKQSIAVDLKQKEGVDLVAQLCSTADVLIEPFRCGVMEKLGLGPDRLCGANKKLIYARLTGFGQTGPYSRMAGHDINYIATAGVLSKLGRATGKPYAPINLVADFAGGGLLCAMGVIMALLERSRSGLGQVIDANMVEGAAYVSSFLWLSRYLTYGVDIWGEGRGKNLLDGGAPFYDTYETKDNRYMAVGALEPQFYRALLKGVQLNEDDWPQFSRSNELRVKLEDVFKQKTQAEWAEMFDGSDACVTPVVELSEAHLHSHNKSNQSFLLAENGLHEPAPAPRMERTPAVPNLRQPRVGEHTVEILKEIGHTDSQIETMLLSGIIQNFVESKL